MKTKEMIRLVAEGCYRPKPEGSYLLAMQLFVESLVLSADVSSYTVDEMELYINNFLDSFEEWQKG